MSKEITLPGHSIIFTVIFVCKLIWQSLLHFMWRSALFKIFKYAQVISIKKHPQSQKQGYYKAELQFIHTFSVLYIDQFQWFYYFKIRQSCTLINKGQNQFPWIFHLTCTLIATCFFVCVFYFIPLTWSTISVLCCQSHKGKTTTTIKKNNKCSTDSQSET